MGNISNSCLHALPREQVHVTIGPELFGPSFEGQTAVIYKTLYYLKSSGAVWRHYFAQFIRTHLHYKATTADPDVYMKKLYKTDGSKSYSYLLVYVDDILVISEEPQTIISEIQ